MKRVKDIRSSFDLGRRVKRRLMNMKTCLIVLVVIMAMIVLLLRL